MASLGLTQVTHFTPPGQPPPSSMSNPLTFLPGGGHPGDSTSISSSTSKTASISNTTLKTTVSGQSGTSVTTSAVESSASGSSTIASSGNVLSATSSPSPTMGGEIGASVSSSSSFSTSTASPGLITGAEVKCSSLSCNPGKAAAVFVPIAIVFALLALCVVFFCVRRKGRAKLGEGLAFFSHGAEANYVSAPASSAGNSRAPSMREAGSSYGPLAAGAGLGAAGAAGLAAARGNGHTHDHDFGLGFVPDMVSRSPSDAQCAAPPPYAPRQSNDMTQDAVEPADITRHSPLAAPAAAHTISDPFADTLNPFVDDADDNTSLLSGDTAIAVARGDSRRSVRDNASIVSSLRDMDEVGSIREAQVANISRGPSISQAARGRS